MSPFDVRSCINPLPRLPLFPVKFDSTPPSARSFPPYSWTVLFRYPFPQSKHATPLLNSFTPFLRASREMDPFLGFSVFRVNKLLLISTPSLFPLFPFSKSSCTFCLLSMVTHPFFFLFVNSPKPFTRPWSSF